MKLALIAAGSAALAALSAAAPDLPEYEVGDAFVYSDGRVERVLAVKGNDVTWAGLTGPGYTRHRNFIVPATAWRSGRGSGRREVRGTPDEIWPMSQPRSVRFRVITEVQSDPAASPTRSASLWVCKSGKPRSLSVPAGTFEAISVFCDRYSSTTMRLIERRSWDYAPEVGHYIRRSSLNYLRGTKSSIELVAALTGPAASRARLAAIVKQVRSQSERPQVQR